MLIPSGIGTNEGTPFRRLPLGVLGYKIVVIALFTTFLTKRLWIVVSVSNWTELERFTPANCLLFDF